MLRRNIEDRVRAALSDTPIVLLNGARQTGKTTLVRAIASETGHAYLTFDDVSTAAAAGSDPSGFIQSLKGKVVLDEVQKVPQLFPAIKIAVDRDRQPGRFLLTGSANVMTLPKLSESLVGRLEVITLYPFSAGELAGKKERFLPGLFSGTINEAGGVARASIDVEEAEDIGARLVRGGYPEATRRPSDDRRSAWFASYVSTLLQRDVRELARVDALHSLPNLLCLLAARTSGLLNIADVSRDASLPHTSATRYLALLESLFLLERLPAWSPNLGKRLVKAPKLHLADTGLACHLLGVDVPRITTDRQILGRLLETFVVGELRKQISFGGQAVRMHHLRAAAGAEVDVVLERADGALVALEVKAGASVGASDFSAMRQLRDRLGPRFRLGVVLCLGEQALPFGERLWSAPVSALWEG
ncbi:MAG: ATP-binding protein [Polyangia bacterium]|jgi:predicted AAA+ superfamily ATPase|nr:ATP-binding protein [Polyangia bacterium]